MPKLTLSLSLAVLATFTFTLGCSSGTCVPIPDGVYTVIDPNGGPAATAALVVPLSDAGLIDAALPADAGIHPDAAIHLDAAARDAAPSDAATISDAGTAGDAGTPHDAATVHDAATAHDAATRDDASAHDAAPTEDAGMTSDAGGPVPPLTYTFHGGLPVPYDTWDCVKPTLTCEMTYICSKPGEQTVSIVTSYTTGTLAALAFSVTPPGTIVHLQPAPH